MDIIIAKSSREGKNFRPEKGQGNCKLFSPAKDRQRKTSFDKDLDCSQIVHTTKGTN